MKLSRPDPWLGVCGKVLDVRGPLGYMMNTTL